MPNLHVIGACLLAGATAMSQAAAQGPVSSTSSSLELRYELSDLDLADNIQPAVRFTDWIVSSTNGYRNALGALEREESSTFGTTSIARAAGYARTHTSPTALRSEAVFASSDPGAHWFSAENRLSIHFILTPSTQIRLIASAELSSDPTPARVGHPRYAEILSVIYGPDSFASGQGWGMGEGRYELASLLHTGPTGASGVVNLQTLAQLEVASVPEPSTAAMLLSGLLLAATRASQSWRRPSWPARPGQARSSPAA